MNRIINASLLTVALLIPTISFAEAKVESKAETTTVKTDSAPADKVVADQKKVTAPIKAEKVSAKTKIGHKVKEEKKTEAPAPAAVQKM